MGDGRHIHQYNPAEAGTFNVSHTINSVSFGKNVRKSQGGNPLDSLVRIVDKDVGTGLYQYFIKVIPTEFTNTFGYGVKTNTYTMTERFRPMSLSAGHAVLPGIFFIYDISPFQRKVVSQTVSLSHFISRLFAIVGGVYTLVGVLDVGLYRL